MKKFKLFAFALATLFSASVLAYDAPAEGSYDLTTEATAKVSNGGRFIVISNGLYAYRLSSGYSYSNGNGLKTQSNQGGFVFQLNENTKLTCSIKHTESKNAHTVTINVYSISEEQYAEFDNNKTAATKNQTLSLSGLTPSTFTIDIPAETNTFTGTQELAAGYYAVVPTGEKSNTYMSAIAFELAAAIVDPVAKVTIASPAMGVVNTKASFSATTDVKADEYEWFVNGNTLPGGSNSKTMEFTPMAAGTYSVVCKARNANNAENEWAADTVAFQVYSTVCGELIKAVHTGSTTATVTGIVGGTADKNTQSDSKLGGGHYFGIQLASGNFQEGDTLNVNLSGAATGGNQIIIYAEKEAQNVILETGVMGVVGDNKFVLPAAVNNKSALYVVRTDANGWNGFINSLSVIRPMAALSTVESLTGAAINDAPLAAADLATLLSSHTLILQDSSYVDAPVVKFTKHLVITYEDESVSERDEVISVTSQQASATTWGAATTINEIAYSVYTVKKSSFAVRYMDGETELGTENVEANGHPANYAQYQYKNLYTFVGWYNNADLADEHLVADMSAEVITDAATYYAKFTEKYAASINFEKAVMENGKGYAIINQLGTLGYSTNITGSLDSLDNSKTDSLRNYAYLGLKVKQNGALLNFRLEEGKTVNIKFGNIAKTPQVSINGGEFADMTITDKVYTRTAAANEVISIKMMDVNAVVFQQIMIGDLEAPELFAINCAEAENGTVAAQYRLGIPGEVIALTITPAEGYKIGTVTVNSEEIHPVEDAYSFTMPAAVANVSASFGETTGIENTNAEMKAVKRLENGMLIIEKNGAIYNIIGARVK